jgi:hypothetical protein
MHTMFCSAPDARQHVGFPGTLDTSMNAIDGMSSNSAVMDAIG